MKMTLTENANTDIKGPSYNQSISWTPDLFPCLPCAPTRHSWGPEDRRQHQATPRAGATGNQPRRNESCQARRRWVAVSVPGAAPPHPRASDLPVAPGSAAVGTPRTRYPVGRPAADCPSLPQRALRWTPATWCPCIGIQTDHTH